MEYLIVCPLVFLAGFIDAIAGGGGLISLPAYLIAGLPPHSAIGTNKFSACLGTTVATWHYARCGFIKWRQVAPAVVMALAGSALGARLALLVDSEIFKIIMLVILPLTACYVLRRRNLGDDRIPFSTSKTSMIASALALLIGIYDGFYGPGTGTFLMLLLTAMAHMSLKEAAGTTKAINLSTNVAALAVFLWHGVVWIPLALVASAFGIAGNYIGARYFTSKESRIARPIIIIVLSIFFIKICFELLGII
ncbi:MAG: sulfite exporter TauE/SafE family protein [Bacteroidales bacterium]|nr:sulfite exporter TauE/SafE family protein [Bacteroidales bacterium]